MHRTLPPDPVEDRRRLAAGWRMVDAVVDDQDQPWVTWEVPLRSSDGDAAVFDASERGGPHSDAG